MDRFWIVIIIAFALLLSACATPQETRLTLEDALAGKSAISIPMRVTEKGLIVLEDIEIDGRNLDMVLDTGATQSAIFQSALNRLNLNLSSDSDTMVHGMIQSKSRRVVNIPKLRVGPLQYLNKPMVVLDDREPDFRKLDIYDGLIGMDILSKYQVYISPTNDELRFISNETPVFVSYFWPRIFLKENPFQIDDRTLHFMEIRVDGRNTPAMLDTGAEFSAMNWPAATYAQAKPIRKRLREQWELQGAVGVFRPTARVRMDRIRGGQIFWDDKEFIIMDFDSLDVLGIDNKPFIIAGMNLFSEETIFMDFERGFLTIVPKSAEQKTRSE